MNEPLTPGLLASLDDSSEIIDEYLPQGLYRPPSIHVLTLMWERRTIFKSGNSLVIGIPAEIVTALGLRKGSKVLVMPDIVRRQFIIRKED